ncbi:substrate-binding domain-containing protein [Candidatus Galacturonibacter soehngenii]|uniref:Sugar ABC transporter substrate-binding protein n=1 Tax=Candidatus Galacturonatibacter soehngenii TaxID=2307010 RepID=A0A7V7UC13_9FIRM|nr:substrate-binding domain-containing protein [Candidatus Galacturonibacter soehngenii]KAB1438663.1 sugar ABC transporter substrate-binding protein [Candidatus Galacturonibacter soehngenii]
MKKAVAYVAFVCVILMLSGCSKNANIQSYNVKDDKIEIGMCFDSFVIERWQRDRDVFVTTAKELGAEVNVQNANGSLETQVSQIKYFIDKQVDVIVIIAIDSKEITDVVKEAKKAGIKVVAYDRLISEANVDLYISFDNEKVGELMAEALVSKLDKNKEILMLCGPTTDTNVAFVEKGFYKVMDNRGIKVANIMNADGWKAELAYSYLSDNYQIAVKIGGIMCGNDSLAGQAVRYLSERRLAGTVPVVGQDADLDACQRIVEGVQLMTVYKPVENLAKATAKYAVMLAKGEEIEVTDTIHDNKYEVSYIKLEPIAVTAKNMDEVIIDSGFHLREDVYLNVPEE